MKSNIERYMNFFQVVFVKSILVNCDKSLDWYMDVAHIGCRTDSFVLDFFMCLIIKS